MSNKDEKIHSFEVHSFRSGSKYAVHLLTISFLLINDDLVSHKVQVSSRVGVGGDSWNLSSLLIDSGFNATFQLLIKIKIL